jgi:hypothetical protein
MLLKKLCSKDSRNRGKMYNISSAHLFSIETKPKLPVCCGFIYGKSKCCVIYCTKQRRVVWSVCGKARKCRMKTLLRQFLTLLSRRRAEYRERAQIEFTRARLLLPRKQITSSSLSSFYVRLINQMLESECLSAESGARK